MQEIFQQLQLDQISDILKTFHKYTNEYGTMVHFRLGPVGHMLLSSDYDFFEFLLSSKKLLSRPNNMKYLESWLGKGIATANGEKWKSRRRLLNPIFHYKILEKFVEIFESGGSVLVEKLSKMDNTKSMDIHPHITRCTLDIVCESVTGTKMNVQNRENSLYFQSVKNMSKIFMNRTMSITKCYDCIYRFTRDYAVEQESLKHLHGFTDSVISKKLEQLRNKPTKSSTEPDEDNGRKAFLDTILEADETLSHKEIREELNTLIFAGYETTAAATSFILFCLAKHKEVQDKILEEQERIFGNGQEAKVTYANLQEMKYLENVVKEGLRLYSPLPLQGREIDQDVEFNGITIPKGVTVFLFAHGIHMNPRFYPDPDKFDPSRFDDDKEKKPFAFIPFSAGLRSCIGQKFAMLVIKSLVAKIVRNFEFFPAFPEHKLELAAESVLKSLNGVKIGLKLRQDI
ncbi:cytochrome P450 4d2-like isoform X2 [Tenebrio molitor]|uniref:cytochrome P450 4d2-like isoform X2 n=1 Tax=Tenebrio molitor TaxID=7067 RepID=UPI0036248ED8